MSNEVKRAREDGRAAFKHKKSRAGSKGAPPMLFTILAIGIGLIIALGGAIMLDRNRTEAAGRAAYAFSTACGLALVAAPMLGIM